MESVDATFVQQVANAFKVCSSSLALSRTALAQGPLVTPGLVLDELSPTLDERGKAIRFALVWSVEQIAPDAPTFPIGAPRPLDDATWREPRWWRYNLLRHRFLEPLHPEDSIEGARYVETLIALTGLGSIDAYYEERAQAVHDAARWLNRQVDEGVGSERIQALALADVLAPLQSERSAFSLLGIASVFSGVFLARDLILLAEEENLRYPDRALAHLLSRRCLLAGDGTNSLWMSPALRGHVAALQVAEKQERRHLLAARLCHDEGRPLATAVHLLDAGLTLQAAQAIAELGEAQRQEYAPELPPLISRIRREEVEPLLWRQLQLLLADLFERGRQPAEAIVAYEAALETTTSAGNLAAIQHKLAVLYEERDPDKALASYQAALDHLPETGIDTALVLRDRAALRVQLQDWSAAEADLTAALALLPAEDAVGRADLLDVYSALRRGQGEYGAALDFAQRVLALRKESGDRLRTGKALNTLGILHRMMGSYRQAIVAYEEALALFEQLDHQALVATTYLNIGTALHFSDNLVEAERNYRRCLALADEVGLPLTEVRAHANLCEALFDQGREAEARSHWRQAYGLSLDSGFEDEIAYLHELCNRYPILRSELSAVERRLHLKGHRVGAMPEGAESWAAPAAHGTLADQDETTALEMAQGRGRVSAADLMHATGVSKATATRKLSRLCEAGFLARHGQGRSTYYTRVFDPPEQGSTGDVTWLQARLDAIQPRFGRRYGVRLLEARGAAQVALASGERVTRFDIYVVFETPPDLDGFFVVERALGEALRVAVNLVQ